MYVVKVLVHIRIDTIVVIAFGNRVSQLDKRKK